MNGHTANEKLPKTGLCETIAKLSDEQCVDANENDNELTDNTSFWIRYTNIPFRLLGYGMLMGWHFLLLYFFIEPLGAISGPTVLFSRQVALNASLALSFALLSLLGKYNIFSLSNLFIGRIVFVSILTSIATIGMIFAALYSSATPMILLTILAGSTESVLITAWLHYYSETSQDYATQYITLSLVIGALVAFFIYHLTAYLSYFCFALLPTLSAIMLISSVLKTPIRCEETGERGIRDYKDSIHPLFSSTLFLAVYGAAFGFLQGSNSFGNNSVLAIFSPNTVIGAGLAGLVTAFIYYKFHQRRAREALRRTSLMLFITGLLFAVFPSPFVKNCAGSLIMMSFIVIDIAVLTFIVRLIRSYDLNSFFVIGLNRAAEYAAFAVFIVVGAALSRTFGSLPYYPFITCGTIIIIVLGYTLISMGENRLNYISQLYPQHPQRPQRNSFATSTPLAESAHYKANGEDEAFYTEGRWKTRCRIICEQSKLSSREAEVFCLMAKGRNAEYIQDTLIISKYTAKTHIANIYRKVGVHSLQELIDTVEKIDQKTVEQYRSQSSP